MRPLHCNVKLQGDAHDVLRSVLGNQCRWEGRIMATELRLLFRLCVPDQLLLIVYAVVHTHSSPDS